MGGRETESQRISHKLSLCTRSARANSLGKTNLQSVFERNLFFAQGANGTIGSSSRTRLEALTRKSRDSTVVSVPLELVKSNVVRPFGYPDRNGAAQQVPLRLNGIEQYGSPSNIYALTDADRKNSPPEGNPWWGQLPSRPVHGNRRNELYFDWHVDLKSPR